MKRLLALLFALFGAASAQAHFLWAHIDKASRNIAFLVSDGPQDEPLPMRVNTTPGKAKSNRIHLENVNGGPNHDHLNGQLSKGEHAGGFELVFGIHSSSLVTWYSKAAIDLAGASSKIGLGAEIVLSGAGGNLVAQVLLNGKPSTDAQMEVYLPGKTEPWLARTDSKGRVKLPHVPRGQLFIGAQITEKRAGTYEGQQFTERLSMPSLSVQLG